MSVSHLARKQLRPCNVALLRGRRIQGALHWWHNRVQRAAAAIRWLRSAQQGRPFASDTVSRLACETSSPAPWRGVLRPAPVSAI
eukprot:12605940-Prorocentrum_lima.AAC.1